MKKAVFLDRDGSTNHPNTQCSTDHPPILADLIGLPLWGTDLICLSRGKYIK